MNRREDRERAYTPSEAAREPARRECETHGHDLEIVHQGFEPVRLVCGRGCGHRGWTVVPVVCAGHQSGPAGGA